MDFDITLVQQPGVSNVDGTGISHLPNWKLTQARKQSHPLNLLLIGAPGVGKRTFINCLFGSEIIPNDGEHAQAGGSMCRQYSGERVEGGVRLEIKVDKVLGFDSAQSLDDPEYFERLLAKLEESHRQAYLAEGSPDRNPAKAFDNLYHAVVYFISPTFLQFTRAEIRLLSELQKLTLVVPVLAKADMYTAEELQRKKISIRTQLKANQIALIPHLLKGFTDTWLVNDLEDISNRWPLALISSTQIHQCTGEDYRRARVYPWGMVDVDNADYSDFLYVEKLLIASFYTLNKQYIKETLYEGIWRPRFLQGTVLKSFASEDEQPPIPIQDLSIADTK